MAARYCKTYILFDEATYVMRLYATISSSKFIVFLDISVNGDAPIILRMHSCGFRIHKVLHYCSDHDTFA